MKLNPFHGTFGLPPSSYVSDTMIVNSMPILEITPGIPQFQSGLTLFRVNDAWTEYNKILNSLGFELPSKSIRLAFIADNFPTDSFTNEYGETFLQKFTDVASQGMQQIAQMMGANSGTQGVRKFGDMLKNIGEQTGGMTGDVIGSIGSGASGAVEAVENFIKANRGGMLGGATDILNKMVAGNRVDFPMIWRNSGYTPSYTVTIRLYNPNPANPDSTERHIIGPLAVILALGIPRSRDGKTFNWPFFHKIKSPGIYYLNPSVITNITVVKGGDQQQIAYNQKLAMVDVRMDFTSLYNTMLLEEGSTFEQQRPTVNNYLKSLREDGTEISYTRDQMRAASANAAGVTNQSDRVFISSNNISPIVQQIIDKNESARRRQSPTVTDQATGNRVNLADSQLAAALARQLPSGL